MDISIHALLAESDLVRMLNGPHSKISIHALLAESDSLTTYLETSSIISIHALLAESDVLNPLETLIILTFLSTLSLRRATHRN